jgi:hypothetical protein
MRLIDELGGRGRRRAKIDDVAPNDRAMRPQHGDARRSR